MANEEKTIRKYIRGDETIKSKITVDFGGGHYRTIPEIEVIKKIINKENGNEKKVIH